MKQKQRIDSDQEDAASDIAETARTRRNTADHILRDSLETDCDHNGEQDADGSPSMGLGYRKSGDEFFSRRPLEGIPATTTQMTRSRAASAPPRRNFKP